MLCKALDIIAVLLPLYMGVTGHCHAIVALAAEA